MPFPKHAILLVVTSVVLVASIGFIVAHSYPQAAYSLTHIEIADTDAAREQGLSGRSEVADDYGMLFIFPKEGDYGFWMKDMRVPLDIIWLNDDGTIAGAAQNLATSTYPTAVYPPHVVRFVLEVAAGTMEKRGWATSTPLSLPLR